MDAAVAPEDRTRALVRATFDAAAPHFDDPALFFWDRLGRRTVELAAPAEGQRVLDVCCGTGASALPAARAVGPRGSVLGIDLSEGQLRRARAKATGAGLDHVRFVTGDLEDLRLAPASADLVVCVLGLYFARDLSAAVAGLARPLRPGGTLAVTTWGRRSLEPGQSLYLDAVAAERPDLDLRTSTLSWARIDTAAKLAGVFAGAGLPPPVVEEETVRRPVDADGFWRIVLGSGYRLMLDAMGGDAAERVRADLDRRFRDAAVTEVVCDVLYARCTVAGARGG